MKVFSSTEIQTIWANRKRCLYSALSGIYYPESFFQLTLIASHFPKRKKFLDWFQMAYTRCTIILTAVTSPTSFLSILLYVRQICLEFMDKSSQEPKHVLKLWCNPKFLAIVFYTNSYEISFKPQHNSISDIILKERRKCLRSAF